MPDNNYRVHIPEQPYPGRRLGRHVNHDPRSLRYLVGHPVGAIQSVLHERVLPVLDQGQVGACTAFAAVGDMGTKPLWDSLPANHPTFDAAYALGFYSEETQDDSYPGSYPPDDTGSDGLTAAKVAQKRGLISGYLHATNILAMQSGLQNLPLIAGTNWTEGMFNPDSNGQVHPSGDVAGGHEYSVIGLDVDKKLFHCVNSWGESWGIKGHFFISFNDMDNLLHADGDCTQFLPLTAPPPIPAPVADKDLDTWWAATRAWAHARHVGGNAAAAKAALTFAKAKGLN